MKLCSIENCGKKYLANGYCAAHNALYKRHGDPLMKKGRWDGHVKTDKKCITPDCENIISKGNYCGKCRVRKSRHGCTTTVLPKGNKEIWKLSQEAAKKKLEIDMTWKEFKDKYQNRKIAFNRIRTIGRIEYRKNNRPQCCIQCGWKRYDICHIRSVSNYKDHEMISEINKPTNLMALCPNHHDLFDNGWMSIDHQGTPTFDLLPDNIKRDEFVAIVSCPDLIQDFDINVKMPNRMKELGWMSKESFDE